MDIANCPDLGSGTEADRPGPQYHYEVFGPSIRAWFPWKFWLCNWPKVDWPLSLQDREMERYEKETMLVAIYRAAVNHRVHS